MSNSRKGMGKTLQLACSS